MDGKFRLVFSEAQATPSAADYMSPGARVYDSLKEAVTIGYEDDTAYGAPYIAHRHMVFDPMLIDVLYEQLVAGDTGT